MLASTRKTVTHRLQLVRTRRNEISPYIELLEATAEWLTERGIRQYSPGAFRATRSYFAASIEGGEVYWACLDAVRVGTVRLLSEDSIVWPDVPRDEAIYINNLVVQRGWGHRGVGLRILNLAEREAWAMGRAFVRLDCVAENRFLRKYYAEAGFLVRGEIDARYPEPFGTIRLQRFEKRIAPVLRSQCAESTTQDTQRQPLAANRQG